MSWENKRHVTKIFNAFKRNKDRIYKEDIEALKSIDELINEKSKSLTHGNLVYAKLLCLYLKQNANYYKGVKMAVKSLQSELKKPLEHHLSALEKELNHIDTITYLEGIGLNMSEILANRTLTSEMEKDIIVKLQNSWTKEAVEKSFYNTANDLLKTIENYT